MTDHLIANDGTDWTSEPSPVNAEEAREADKAAEETAAAGQGPAATNDVSLSRTIVVGSESKNG